MTAMQFVYCKATTGEAQQFAHQTKQVNELQAKQSICKQSQAIVGKAEQQCNLWVASNTVMPADTVSPTEQAILASVGQIRQSTKHGAVCKQTGSLPHV